jgi:hypothetical protein
MVQTLKRVYLYTAATFALLFTAALAVIMLNTILNLAGMLPYYANSDGSIQSYSGIPDTQQVETTVILFVITVVLVGLLFGGGHYWLIRRDARSDPAADGGAVRHFFLNALLALAALVGVPTGLFALADIDLTPGYHDTALPLSFVLVAAVVFVYVYLERRRVNPAGNAAIIIRQIQENVMQAILLVIASVILFLGITSIVTGNVVTPPECFSFSGVTGSQTVPCPPPPLLSPILTTVFALAAWGLYVWIGAWSRDAVLQRIVWYAALGYGVVWLLYGFAQAIYTAVAPLFGDGNAWQEALDGSLLFVGAIITGGLITLVYVSWLRHLAARLPRLQELVPQGLLAVPAALSAGFFLTGIIQLLSGVVEQVVPGGKPFDADGWAQAIGIFVGGIMYPMLWALFRRRSDPVLGGPTVPRRVYVLVLLAGTAIGASIAAVFLIYQLVVGLLGLPSADAYAARVSAVILLVLGAMALYHLWQLRVDVRVIHARAPAVPEVPAPAPAEASVPAEAEASTVPLAPVDGSETLEAILQQVAGGTLDTMSAATRIRALAKL